jgi:hypothetical protein
MGDATAAGRVAQSVREEKLVEDASDLPEPIRATCEWLQFKAPPIKVADLADSSAGDS